MKHELTSPASCLGNMVSRSFSSCVSNSSSDAVPRCQKLILEPSFPTYPREMTTKFSFQWTNEEFLRILTSKKAFASHFRDSKRQNGGIGKAWPSSDLGHDAEDLDKIGRWRGWLRMELGIFSFLNLWLACLNSRFSIPHTHKQCRQDSCCPQTSLGFAFFFKEDNQSFVAFYLR